MRRAFAAAVVLVTLASVQAMTAAGAEPRCRFRGPMYPALDARSKPGNLYEVFIKRSLTCDEARSVALRGTRKGNPGPFRPFPLVGGWSCLSFAPPRVGKVMAGQCVKPGSRALVNWLPVCDPARPACKNLRREP